MALSNARRVFVGNGGVRFRYQNYAAGGTLKVMEWPAAEFLRRFLRHVVPPRFVRIGPFGLLAKPTRHDKLARCRQLLAVAAAAATAVLPTPNAETPPARSPAMTLHGRFHSVYVPPSPSGTTRSGRLAPVCSISAPRLFPAPSAVPLRVARAAVTLANRSVRLRET